MSTFVPIEAKGGMMLHPGPGPFAAGPGPFPARKSLPFSRSCASCADAGAGKSVIAAAVAAISNALARFDNLLMFAHFPPCCWVLIANLPSVNTFPPERLWCSSLCVTSMIRFSFSGIDRKSPVFWNDYETLSTQEGVLSAQ
jgi:hypothetical protein